MQMPSGVLVVRFGARRVLLCSLLLTTISCIGYAFSHSFIQVLGWRLLMGFGCASAICVAMTVAANKFPISMFAMRAGLT